MQCVHVPISPKKIPGDFIQGREALVRLVRIKARFMRQCERASHAIINLVFHEAAMLVLPPRVFIFSARCRKLCPMNVK